VNDYDLLRDYLKKQKLPEFVLTFEQIDKTYLLSQKIGLDRRAFVDEVRRCLVDPPLKSGPPGGGGERPADGA